MIRLPIGDVYDYLNQFDGILVYFVLLKYFAY